MSDWQRVTRADAVGPGEHIVVDVDGASVVVFNLDGKFYALEDVCTHDGGILTGGTIEGEAIVCPRHGAKFCIRTGEALSAPAYEPTATFPVKVEDEEVYVRDDRWD